MKIKYLTDACIVIEHEGKKLLCDPWLSESICYGGLYHYPPIDIDINDYLDVDCIYISHIHEDHLDSETLKHFSKEIPIVIHSYEEKHVFNRLKGMGFINIYELKHKTKFEVAPKFTIEVLAADNCDPAICFKFFGCQVSQLYEHSLQIDSMAVIQGGDYVVVNTNDCPYELSHTMNPYILEQYKKVDFLMTSYNAASPYPQSFDNFTDDEKLVEKEKVRQKCLDRAVSYCKDLQPKYVLPFAAQMVLGGENVDLNAYRAVTPLENVKAELGLKLIQKNINTIIVQLNSEDFFDLSTGEESEDFKPLTDAERNVYYNDILRKKEYLFLQKKYFVSFEERHSLIDELKIAQSRMNYKMKEVYYDLKINTTIYLDVGQDFLYEIPLDGREVSVVKDGDFKEPYLKLTLEYSLLKMILNRQAHWNNAELGGFITYYRKPNIFDRAVHHVISYLHT
ncbi:MBL fold metallo-hydrolase [Lysinibacillus sp. NPDC096418]|uniref:MBL fold metallo-hydrolase n=1 Tax=Lysinibacillus sp. NPDC096418 TaxID=3364138 RepID=UPI0037F32724